jgi:ABC-type Na+ efflux pump permease subunit
MATVAAGSFRRERDLGVMELLLITPLREAELARGRLLGVWEQFLPAIGLLLSVWLWIALSFGERQDWELIVFWVATFISLPVAGLYYSLKQRGTIGALIWTLWTPLLWPLGLAVTGRMLGEFTARFGSPIPEGWVPVWLLPILWQAGWTARNWRRLKATLIARDFPMEVQ